MRRDKKNSPQRENPGTGEGMAVMVSWEELGVAAGVLQWKSSMILSNEEKEEKAIRARRRRLDPAGAE